MATKRKKMTSAIAVATAFALLVGGTFAWQSISQVALNEKEAIVNPGGRLHDDFDGENKDVYVENFADDDIFARVRLDEYFEIVMNKNTPAEKTEVITTGATKADTSTYLTHKFGDENATDDYWEWATGGKTTYMPTFNKNKDSLTADINGTFAEDYADYVDYSEFTGNDAGGTEATGTGAGKTANAIYDADSNTVDEFADDTATKDVNYKEVEETHYVSETGEGSLISMEEWLELADNGDDTDNYWVYDTDGWCYWSSPIKADTATGLLLDGISLTEVMDDSYYYAINVTGQFITANDLGKDDNTGFYADNDNLPSEDALALLKAIGVKTEDEETELVPGLYSEDDKLLCAWEDCGIELNPSEDTDFISNYATAETSGCYVLSNNYPTAAKIILPDDVTSIGKGVFSHCDNLTEIDIKNVENLDYAAFDSCASLTTVSGSELKTIGGLCFRQCRALTTVDLSKIEELPDAALQDTSLLTTADLSNVKTIGNQVFYSCGIKELNLSNVELVPYDAFKGANAEKIYLDKVTEIQSYAFAYMSYLQAIVYKGESYNDVDSLKAALQENDVTLGYYAFSECNFYEPTDDDYE